MQRVLAIVRPQFSPGFLLAGCDVFETERTADVERKVRELVGNKDYALVIFDSALTVGISPYVRTLIFDSIEPIFIEIGLEGTSDEKIIKEIENLAKESLGYSIRIKV